MTRRNIGRSMLVVGVVSCALLQLGCKTDEQPSAVVGDYTFSREFDGERHVLRIEPSAEQPAECMLTDRPADEGAQWKEAMLDPEIHRALSDLRFDGARADLGDLDRQDPRGYRDVDPERGVRLARVPDPVGDPRLVQDEQHPHRARVAEHRQRAVVVREDPRDAPRGVHPSRGGTVDHPPNADRKSVV